MAKKMRESMIFSCEFSKDGITNFEIIPVVIGNDFQPYLLDENEKEKMLFQITHDFLKIIDENNYQNEANSCRNRYRSGLVIHLATNFYNYKPIYLYQIFEDFIRKKDVDFMKLLVAIGLPDRNMMHHIYPITLLGEIDKIMVVRDRKGPKINKVQYYCPPTWSLKIPVFALFLKFILMIYLSIREKPEIIHGYLLFPHGILAFITGILTRKKLESH
ncbi:MAG: hypothetical protein NHB15_17210 [Methanosarcina barkeri]|nr:hypothetical protein [Methanosarcina sp. ERenArc_MAG2]